MLPWRQGDEEVAKYEEEEKRKVEAEPRSHGQARPPRLMSGSIRAKSSPDPRRVSGDHCGVVS